MTRKSTAYGRRVKRVGTSFKCDGITIVNKRNTRLSKKEIARVIDPCKAALQAMRQARGGFAEWLTLCTAHHVGVAIEDGGVFTGQRELFADADAALERIGDRCGRHLGQWTPRACTGPELNALADMIAAHSRQIHELTYGEYTDAADLAVARVETDRGQVFKSEPQTGAKT